jgi:competence protein ComEA
MGQTTKGRMALVLGVISIGGGVALGLSQRDPAPGPATSPSFVPTGASIEIHVGGWVVAPGVITIPEDAIVADAIKAAGGFKPGADSDAVNLAASLADGQQVIVPGPDGAIGGPAASGDGKIAINRATAAELDALPGVGPVLAERIVAHREQHGPFATVEDLLQVSGIGEAKLASIRDLVSVP